MKNEKNAFTLIELLAIIVILAIIAVITVPIILNIIENSRKGASIDSAYGYRDSVQQYYISKSVADSTQQAPSGVKYVSELPADFSVSGTAPSDGWVNLDKGQVLSYSLKFGDYVVTYDESTPSPVSTKNGVIAIASCPGCVFAWHNNQKYLASELNINAGMTNEFLALQKSEYYQDYTKLVSDIEKNIFLGYILDNDGKIQRSFACGIINDVPFCLEGYDTTKYNTNLTTVKNPNLDLEQFDQYSFDNSNFHVSINSSGSVGVYLKNGSAGCQVLGYSSCYGN